MISKINAKLDLDNRVLLFEALSDAELMCIGLNRVVGMIKAIGKKCSVATATPNAINALSTPAKAMEALLQFKQLQLSTSGVVRCRNHSLDLSAQVIPALVAAREFIIDAMAEKTAAAKTITRAITFFDTQQRGLESHHGDSGSILQENKTRWNEHLIHWKRNEIDSPKRTSPIHFAVQMKNGLTSNAWGVRVENTGDAYIYCRDSMKGQKVSLHASGKQHISFDRNAPGMDLSVSRPRHPTTSRPKRNARVLGRCHADAQGFREVRPAASLKHERETAHCGYLSGLGVASAGYAPRPHWSTNQIERATGGDLAASAGYAPRPH